MSLIDEMFTIDIETTIRGKNGTSSSPYCPENEIVSMGASLLRRDSKITDFDNRYYEKYLKPEDEKPYDEPFIKSSDKNKVRISRFTGHNIKFDLNYLRKKGFRVYQKEYYSPKTNSSQIPLREALVDIKIWDTQLAEYLLTGQQAKLVKLNDLGPQYGGTAKIDKIKELWDAGVDTRDIDKDLLLEYQQDDVKNTELIAIQQMFQAKEEGLLEWIETQMNALKAIAEIEYNGMKIDTEELAMQRGRLGLRLMVLEDKIKDIIHKRHPGIPLHVINISSNQQLSALFFGGTIEWPEKVEAGKYKNGKTKYKKVTKSSLMPQEFIPKAGWLTKKAGVFSVNEDVLKDLLSKSKLSRDGNEELIGSILEYRNTSKELNTYIKGITKALDFDGFIHGTLNQNITDTGRLSSSKPNLQNFPSNDSSDIKKLFVSRWGDEGVIIEADYKQLEVICLAYLSGDKQLIDDIVSGRDIHYETGKIAMGWTSPSDMTHDTRRVVKTINFGLIYGGGAATLAKQAGVDIKVARDCIDAFYSRYPETATYVNDLLDRANTLGHYQGAHTKNGLPANEYAYRSITGRKYIFKHIEYSDYRTGVTKTRYSKQQISNYPIQGLATGDIVPMMLGELYEVLLSTNLSDNCLMINTVHDSIIFDCKKLYVREAIDIIQGTMEYAPKLLKEKLDIDFPLPLNVDIKIGPNWKECEDYND